MDIGNMKALMLQVLQEYDSFDDGVQDVIDAVLWADAHPTARVNVMPAVNKTVPNLCTRQANEALVLLKRRNYVEEAAVFTALGTSASTQNTAIDSQPPTVGNSISSRSSSSSSSSGAVAAANTSSVGSRRWDDERISGLGEPVTESCRETVTLFVQNTYMVVANNDMPMDYIIEDFRAWIIRQVPGLVCRVDQVISPRRMRRALRQLGIVQAVPGRTIYPLVKRRTNGLAVPAAASSKQEEEEVIQEEEEEEEEEEADEANDVYDLPGTESDQYEDDGWLVNDSNPNRRVKRRRLSPNPFISEEVEENE